MEKIEFTRKESNRSTLWDVLESLVEKVTNRSGIEISIEDSYGGLHVLDRLENLIKYEDESLNRECAIDEDGLYVALEDGSFNETPDYKVIQEDSWWTRS